MQRFAMVHAGGEPSWPTAYMAFHIAASLAAPLMVLHVGPPDESQALRESAAQVEVSGRAAGVTVESHFATAFFLDHLLETAGQINGLFLPGTLVPDSETAVRILAELACPLWVVKEETDRRAIAILVEDPDRDEPMIRFATSLSRRIQLRLIGLVREELAAQLSENYMDVEWLALHDTGGPEITPIFRKNGAEVLLIPQSKVYLLDSVSINLVIYPLQPDA